jgi:hypothetical protein
MPVTPLADTSNKEMSWTSFRALAGIVPHVTITITRSTRESLASSLDSEITTCAVPPKRAASASKTIVLPAILLFDGDVMVGEP